MQLGGPVAMVVRRSLAGQWSWVGASGLCTQELCLRVECSGTRAKGARTAII